MDLSTITGVIAADRFQAADWQPGDAWLGGGTWLFSEPQPELRRLIDLRAFAWAPLTVHGPGLDIAATCTLAELYAFAAGAGAETTTGAGTAAGTQAGATGALGESPPPAEWSGLELIPQCCRALLGSWKVWHEATVGGNLCLALPAGPMITLATALDGSCTICQPDGGIREVAAIDFVTGAGENALAPGELLRAVTLSERALRSQTAFRRMALSPLGRSAAVVAGRLGPEHRGMVITVTAAVKRPLQLRFPEPPTAAELSEAIVTADPAYHDDVHGDPRWREQLTYLLCEEVRAELERGS